VLDARAVLGECPLWDDREGVLWWVDVSQGRLHRLDPATGADARVDVGQPIGAVGLRAAGGLVLALRDGFGVLDDGELRMVAEVEADRPDQRMNDGASDPRGCFWAGTMAQDERPEMGCLYRLELDGSVSRMVERVTISNGIDWSPDGRLMYYVDSGTQAMTFSTTISVTAPSAGADIWSGQRVMESRTAFAWMLKAASGSRASGGGPSNGTRRRGRWTGA
jgi:sugar lactone lactonase YvrE